MGRNDGRRPKVLIIMEPLVGGTLRHLECLLALTSPEEFDLHLAVSAGRDPAVRARFDEWSRMGWTVHEVPMCRAVSPRRDLIALGRLWALCRRERPDLVHTHSSKAGFLGRLAARMLRISAVHTPHVFAFTRDVPARRYRLLEKLAARWTDRMVLLSEYQRNAVIRHRLLSPKRVVKIPNGVDAAAFEGAERGRARAELGIEGDGLLALTIGRLCHQKGLNVLLDAAALLHRAGAGVRFCIAGSGPMERQLARRIADGGLAGTVVLAGETGRAHLYYAACDLVVAPSRFEGMPYLILEAKAAGRPAAVSLVSGMEEFVSHGHDGFLFPPDNPEALASLLGKVARRPNDLEAMGARARASLKPQWLAQASVARTHALYRELLP